MWRRRDARKPSLRFSRDETAALAIATSAHAGQFDKAGNPYIEHVTRVAAGLPPGDARVVALLHDVLEDTAIDAGALRRQGITEIQLAAVQALTHRADESQIEYLDRVTANALARTVKRADVDDNSDPARLALLDPETQDRLALKYLRAKALLDWDYLFWDGHPDALLRTRQLPREAWAAQVIYYKRETGWEPATHYAMDALTGMGEDLWSSGESSTPVSRSAAQQHASEHGWDLFGPDGEPQRLTSSPS